MIGIHIVYMPTTKRQVKFSYYFNNIIALFNELSTDLPHKLTYINAKLKINYLINKTKMFCGIRKYYNHMYSLYKS